MPGTYNLNAGYGRLLATRINVNTPSAGRVFMVAPTSHPNYDMLQQVFVPDAMGNPRLFTTIAAAQSGMTASEGDVCYIAEGHAETLSTATALGLSKAGITYIGLGIGSLRPTLTLDTGATTTIAVSANNIRIENVIFVANYANVTALFTVTTATNFQLFNCEVRDTSASLNFVTVITVSTTSNAADGLLIDSCKFYLLIATGATKLVAATGTNDRWTIKNNFYSTPTTGTGAVLPISTGKVLTNLTLDGNKFILVQTAGTTTGVLLTTNGSTNSGYISNNFIQTAATTPLGVTASSGFVQTNNLYTHTDNKSGYVMPVIDASS